MIIICQSCLYIAIGIAHIALIVPWNEWVDIDSAAIVGATPALHS